MLEGIGGPVAAMLANIESRVWRLADMSCKAGLEADIAARNTVVASAHSWLYPSGMVR